MRRDLGQVQDDLRGINGIRIGTRRILAPVLNIGLSEALATQTFETLSNAAQVGERGSVDREPPDQWSPFGRHVRDRESRIHGERGDAGTGELDSSVEHLVMV